MLGLWTCPLPPPQSTTQSNNLLQACVSNCAYKEKNIQATQLKRIPFRDEILFYCFSYQVYSARCLEWLLSMSSFSKLGFAWLVLSASEEPLLVRISQEFSSKMNVDFMCLCFKCRQKWKTIHSLAFLKHPHICFKTPMQFLNPNPSSKCHPWPGWDHLWSCAHPKSFEREVLWHQLGGGWARGPNSSLPGSLVRKKKISLWNSDRSDRLKGRFHSGIIKNVHQKRCKAKIFCVPNPCELGETFVHGQNFGALLRQRSLFVIRIPFMRTVIYGHFRKQKDSVPLFKRLGCCSYL